MPRESPYPGVSTISIVFSSKTGASGQMRKQINSCVTRSECFRPRSSMRRIRAGSSTSPPSRYDTKALICVLLHAPLAPVNTATIVLSISLNHGMTISDLYSVVTPTMRTAISSPNCASLVCRLRSSLLPRNMVFLLSSKSHSLSP